MSEEEDPDLGSSISFEAPLVVTQGMCHPDGYRLTKDLPSFEIEKASEPPGVLRANTYVILPAYSLKRPALYNLGCSPILIPSNPTIVSCNLCSLSKMTPRAPPSSLASNSANCAGTGKAADGGPSDVVESVPRREGVLWVMNSVWTGSFIWASLRAVYQLYPYSRRYRLEVDWIRPFEFTVDRIISPLTPTSTSSTPMSNPDLPCFAISSLIPPPPTSNTTLPKGTLQAQYSKLPFPFPILVSLPLTQTGISGKTLINTSAPLTGLIFLFIAVMADVN
jgi:hypothetical protein